MAQAFKLSLYNANLSSFSLNFWVSSWVCCCDWSRLTLRNSRQSHCRYRAHRHRSGGDNKQALIKANLLTNLLQQH